MLNLREAAIAVVNGFKDGRVSEKAIKALKDEALVQMNEHESRHLAQLDHSKLKLLGAAGSEYLGVMYDQDFIGTLTCQVHNGKIRWYATMGQCFVGEYDRLEDAVANIIVAFYG